MFMNIENQNIEFKESWGRGWQKICDGFMAAGLPKPSIESKQGGVLVTFQRNNVNLNATVVEGQESTQKEGALGIMSSKGNEEDTHIDCPKTAQRLPKDCPKTAQRTYEAICRNPNATLAELSAELGISERTIKSHFALLKKARLIERVGGKTYGHWELLQQS